MRKDIENTASKGSSDYIPSNLLISLIQKALTVCERSKPRKRVANTFPTNPWYDEECKAAKRALKENGMNKENKKIYERLAQHKKESYVCKRRTELISLGKHNPKGFWKELQQKKKYIENNITGAHWLDYARTLYERPQQKDVPPIIETSTELFSTEDIKQGIKNLANGKAQDIDGLQAEFLKWGVEVLTPHIRKIFNDVNQNGFPMEWTTSVVIPLFKSGDINNPSNYCTIMINPLLGKLFGGMIERRISSWAEREGKRAKGQVGFRPKHSTIDHCITLRHLIEKVWDTQGEEAFCCFVDFKKAFDTVPRKKLWDRMEELGIPDEFRAAVHKLYEQVRAKIKTREGMSECFGSNIGVKQGCPLSPTLFGLYIDKLEDWLNKTEGGGIQLASYVVKLLLYADDLILISKTAQGLREQLKALELFCQEVGMQVNTNKTKIMIFTLKRKERQNIFLFEGSPLEIVTEYKYLGIDFHHKLSWETCKAKRIHGGWKASFLLQNRCRKVELWDWKTKKTLFGLLVTPVVLYGCEVWGSSMSNHGWRQIERIQKHLITSSLKVKSTVPYEILLAEAGSFSLEASAISRMISYLKKVENMDNFRWPKIVMNDTLERRKKTWMNQNTKWMYKWGINLLECPNRNMEIKNYVIEKFRTAMWTGCLDPETKLDVFILSGQSNMSGRGGVVGDKWDEFVPDQCQPHPSILRFTSDQNWVEATEPLHKDIDTAKVCGVGPGMPFANRLLKQYKECGEKYYMGLVPCAIGGTAIKEWEKGTFLYNTMINRTKKALGCNNGGNHVLRALLWYQGESDALSEESADSYQQNLERFIDDVRSDLQLPNLLFIQVAITMGEPPYSELVKKVRKAQLGVSLPNVYCVDANGLVLYEDKLHLTTKSQ
ncbi:hypothetical protein KI387_020820, partial [Taxus chinensis]